MKNSARVRHRYGWLALIVACAILLRVAAALYMGGEVVALPGIFDQIWYDKLAQRVTGGFGFSFAHQSWPLTKAGAPTAHWSYFYTLYLSGVYRIFGHDPLAARLIQALITGILHPLLTYLLGRELFGRRAGLFAAAFSAVYIYFVYYSAALMTEAFFIVTILAALYLVIRLSSDRSNRWLWLSLSLGLTMGVAVLLRQLFLLIIPGLLLWYFWSYFRGQGRFPWLSSTVIIGLVVLIILPFTLYNFARFDRFVLLNTNAGYALFWANHPIYGNRFQGILQDHAYQELIPEELRDLDEPALEQALLRKGIGFIVDEPMRYVVLSFSRIPVYFQFWPASTSSLISNISRVASFGLFLPFMLGGILYSLASRRVRRVAGDRLVLLIGFVLAYALLHLLSWALIRYRLPVDAVLLIFAGLAADWLWNKISSRRMVAETVSTAPSI